MCNKFKNKSRAFVATETVTRVHLALYLTLIKCNNNNKSIT